MISHNWGTLSSKNHVVSHDSDYFTFKIQDGRHVVKLFNTDAAYDDWCLKWKYHKCYIIAICWVQERMFTIDIQFIWASKFKMATTLIVKTMLWLYSIQMCIWIEFLRAVKMWSSTFEVCWVKKLNWLSLLRLLYDGTHEYTWYIVLHCFVVSVTDESESEEEHEEEADQGTAGPLNGRCWFPDDC